MIVGDLYMIIFDSLSQRYRLMVLETGIILTDEYKSLPELWHDNGDAEMVNSAELIIF